MIPTVLAQLDLMVDKIAFDLQMRGIVVPLELKTVEHFVRTLSSMTRQLYRGELSEYDFVNQMATLIQEQLTRAWNEGMRQNDLDPQEEMKPEWANMLQELILNEFIYVDQFAADIVATSRANNGDEAKWGGLLSRAEMWANRYNETVNTAVRVTKEQKLRWDLGQTEKHCNLCSKLNGIVAFSSEWEELGVHPQDPPNSNIECGGWNCDCKFTPTTERRTRDAYNRILAVSGQLG